MICEKCGKKEATYYYSESINGKKKTVALCSDCAPEGMAIENTLLSGLFGGFSERSPLRARTVEVKKCPVCGITFSGIATSGKVGCTECYVTFKEELTPTIRRIHGNRVYRGDVAKKATSEPAAASAEANSVKAEAEGPIASLRRRLEAAVKEENYELAASLRDEIRALNNKD